MSGMARKQASARPRPGAACVSITFQEKAGKQASARSSREKVGSRSGAGQRHIVRVGSTRIGLDLIYRRGRNFSAPGSSQILSRTCRKPAAASAPRGWLPKLQCVWDVRL
eukprot:353316-Chlamydomonas_euryale.AAC.2